MAKKWLAVDFDETVACGEREVPLTVESLVRLQAAGWRLILLTMLINGMKSRGKKRDNLGSIGKDF